MPRIHASSRMRRRAHDRLRFRAALEITSPSGTRLTNDARCTEIGLGGLRASASHGLPPGTPVRVSLRLRSGRHWTTHGRVAWCQQTIRPALFGSPRTHEDDASFGIEFQGGRQEDTLAIARLLVARDHERGKARRLRRRFGLAPIHPMA